MSRNINLRKKRIKEKQKNLKDGANASLESNCKGQNGEMLRAKTWLLSLLLMTLCPLADLLEIHCLLCKQDR